MEIGLQLALTGLAMFVIMAVWLIAFCFLIHRGDREESQDNNERLPILCQDFLHFHQQQQQQQQQQHHHMGMSDPNISIPYQ